MKPITAIRRKHRLLHVALERGLELPDGFGPGAGVFGPAAVRLTKAVQHELGMKGTGAWSAGLEARLDQAGAVTLTVARHDWSWGHPLGERRGEPSALVHHHAAARRLTAGKIHAAHRSQGWAGIGYHRYIEKDGEIHAGRPLWAMGAHCKGHNDTLGVCSEGDYDVEETMPARQLVALLFVRASLRLAWPQLPERRHGEMPGNATACPGRHYPWRRVTASRPDARRRVKEGSAS